MLKTAFNSLIRIHSRPSKMKRLGTPNLFTPITITPSNYFRFQDGPSAMTIHGREFIIPIDSMKGTKQQLISFSAIPTTGTYLLTYNAVDTTPLNYNDAASVIQAALRAITGLEAVVVAGAYNTGFTVTFYGVETPLDLTATKVTGDEPDADFVLAAGEGVKFDPIIKRGDKIIHDLYGHLAIDQIIEMCDIGGVVMGFRVRAE